ncbi:MAG: APC family permease [Renibacterium salmoninarum]|nr:APC family permease [Renibacterium salmoninarum]
MTDSARLKGNVLGTAGVALMVIAAAAPLSVLAGVAPLALSIGGIGTPVVYLVAGAVLGLFAVGFIAMVPFVRSTGGFYGFIAAAFGRRAGVGAAIVAVVSYNALQIGLYGLLGAQASLMFRNLFGWDVPWILPVLATIAVVWFLGFRGINTGARVLALVLAAETAILALLAAAILFRGGANGIGLESFSPEAIFAPGMAVILTVAFAAFLGFESTALYREEARNPNRTIPRATVVAIAFLALFYSFITWSIVQGFGAAEVQAIAGEELEGLFFGAMEIYLGPWASAAMSILIVISIFASQLAIHNANNRYCYSLAKDAILPPLFGKVHPTFRTPYVAGLLQSALALVIVLSFAAADADPFLQLMLWINSPGLVGISSLQALTAIGAVVFFAKRRSSDSRPAVIICSAIAALCLIATTTTLILTLATFTNADFGTNAVFVAITPLSFLLGFLFLGRPKRAAAVLPDQPGTEPRETSASDASPKDVSRNGASQPKP